MKTPDYTASIMVNATAQEAFNAINNVQKWWSTSFEGSTEKLNDIFTVRFGEVYITSKIVELAQGRKIVWEVIDCNKPWLKNTREWNGTKMNWEISKKNDKTLIRFTHLGLVQEIECFEVCSNAWGDYLQNSLWNLITKGKGKPTISKEDKAKPVKLGFTTTIVVTQTPEEAFKAINNPRGWWSEEIDGGTDKLNDEFTYHYQDIHKCRMKLVEVIPHKKVVWLVLDNFFKFTKDKSEWKDTKVIFEISEKDGKTHICFTHQGLVPDYECYDICSNAWSEYIQQSLRNLVTKGKGKPNSKVAKR